MSQYARGRAFEHRAKRWFEALGYSVWPTPGSKTIVDLICLRADGRDLLVQVKRRPRLGSRDWNELWRCAQRLGRQPVFVGANGDELIVRRLMDRCEPYQRQLPWEEMPS